MKILTSAITIDELKQISLMLFGDFVKSVVDVDKKIIAIDAELHVDVEFLLLKNGSEINLRPSYGNMTRGVDSKEVREQIITVINQWIKR